MIENASYRMQKLSQRGASLRLGSFTPQQTDQAISAFRHAGGKRQIGKHRFGFAMLDDDFVLARVKSNTAKERQSSGGLGGSHARHVHIECRHQ